MKPLAAILLMLVVGAAPVRAWGQSAEVEQDNRAALGLRAHQAFAAGEYALALPMIKDLAVRWRSDPQRVGPILEKIQVAEREIAAGNRGPGAPPAEPRTAHPPLPPEAVREITIKELGNFDYDPEQGGNVPADVLQMNGSTVKLSGFMIPLDQAERITRFALVPDLFACCFGAPPQIQHIVIVGCPPGKGVSYYPEEITVEGRLSVQEKKEDGFIVSLFELEPRSVRPVVR